MNLYQLSITKTICCSILITGCNNTDNNKAGVPDSLRNQSIVQLESALQTGTRFVKVHAAEYLLSLSQDHSKAIRKTFIAEEKLYGTEPKYRLGIWRVMAQAEPENKKFWVDKIFTVYRDKSASDRLGGAESLAKLTISPFAEEPAITWEILKGEATPLSAFTLWAASVGITDRDSIWNNRNTLLNLIPRTQKSNYIRSIAAVALNRLGGLDGGQWHSLRQVADAEPDTSAAKIYLLSSAYVTAPEDSVNTVNYQRIRKELLETSESSNKDIRYELATALSKKGGPSDLELLSSLLNNKNPIPDQAGGDMNADVRIAAAYAILKIDERLKSKK